MRRIPWSAVGVALFAATASASACRRAAPPIIATDAAPEDVGDISITEDAAISIDTFVVFADTGDTAFPQSDAPDAGPLPVVPCSDAPTDAVACPLPPSKCIDRQWLASYVNGVCEEGYCRYWRVLQDCSAAGGSSCAIDHCQTAIVK